MLLSFTASARLASLPSSSNYNVDLSPEKPINGVVGGLRRDLMYPGSLLKQCSYIMSIELPLSMYILLTFYEAIIVVMTTELDDGMKVSYEMLRDGTCDQFSITSLPLLLLECHARIM
ncbi:hypothetical protein Tco_1155331 [Tanacetum coccineum]